MRLYLPRTLCSLAEAQAKTGHPGEGLSTLAEALALVEHTDERYWEAELHRLRAELLLTLGDEAEAEVSLHNAIEVARRQSAKSWELAAKNAVETAGKTLKNLRIAEISQLDLKIDNNKVTAYRARVKVSFKYLGK